MVMELVAGKLIARHVGMSLYTWTSVIGIVMAGISVGNFLGGRIADRFRPIPTLAVLFLAAAAGCLGILPMNGLSGGFAPYLSIPWPARVFIHVTIVFFLPAMMLGLINPVVAKMALDFKRAQGRTVGGVFAWGVAGSLIGTFATGFYLVSILSVTTIVLVSAAGLALLGILYVAATLIGRPSPKTDSLEMLPVPDSGNSNLWWPAISTVFISNAAFMSFELALMRVVSREFGGSLYTWTTVIGVVLAGISLGNYCGGRLADRWTAKTLIALIFCLSAATILLTPAQHVWMSVWRGAYWGLASMSWPMQTVIHVMFVGFIPCFFIGMVSPVVTRRLLVHGNAPGASVGIIYAWGSVGAIVGTFLSGYFLIQSLGSIPLVNCVALLLALTALCYAPLRIWTIAIACLSGLAVVMASFSIPALSLTAMRLGYRSPHNPHLVYENESQYSYIAVMTTQEDPEVREMTLDRLVHTRIDMRDHARLLYEYEWVYSAIMDNLIPPPSPLRAFVIGGGGYAYPHYIELVRPNSDVVVAEIDPAVTEAAHDAMGLPRDTSMTIYHLDARNVVTDMVRTMRSGADFPRFDIILGDSISHYTVPFHLTTVEFKSAIYDLLTDEGVYLFNMIDMLDSGAFLAAAVTTCRQVFPQVAVFNTGRPESFRDTFVVACAKKNIPLEHVIPHLHSRYGYQGERLSDERLDSLIARNNAVPLTDGFAPVENLLAPVVRARNADKGELHLELALRHARRSRYEQALYHCNAALELRPQWPQAHETIAQVLTMKGDTDGAIAALQQALQENPDPAPILRKLANALTNAGRAQEALDAWNAYIQNRPEDTTALYNVGVLYAAQNQLSEAIAAWSRVIAITPDHADSLYNLAVAYIMQQDLDSARKMVNAMRSFGHPVNREMLSTVGLEP